MLSRYITKIPIFFAIAAIAVSCTVRRDQATTAGEAPLGGVPFIVTEPGSFQTMIVVTAGDITRASFVARSGTKQRYEFDVGKRSALVLLVASKTIIVLPEKQVYAEVADGTGDQPWRSDAVVLGWLNERGDRKFEKVGESGGAVQYRVTFGDGASSEALIWVDAASGLPVRQEFYGLENGERNLTMTVAAEALKIPADESLFEIPAGYRKIGESELREMHRGILKNG